MATTAPGRPFANIQQSLHRRGRFRPRHGPRRITSAPCTGLLSAACTLTHSSPFPASGDPSVIILTVAILRLWTPYFFYGPRALFLPASHPFSPPTTCHHGRHCLPSSNVGPSPPSARPLRCRRQRLSPVSGPTPLSSRTATTPQPGTTSKNGPSSLIQVIALCNLSLSRSTPTPFCSASSGPTHLHSPPPSPLLPLPTLSSSPKLVIWPLQ